MLLSDNGKEIIENTLQQFENTHFFQGVVIKKLNLDIVVMKFFKI